ncbi:hypothetical protein AVEN_240898-1 [Araneus ventricosus]|uniref:Uncharacterized protein n=1 Tax=Araneus ventricosus TaxID=182803 RepID=A0A4Y2K1L7_ARAVE|nr:hypothetical protein AVEN_240898-1 [Araneus ventricosus]
MAYLLEVFQRHCPTLPRETGLGFTYSYKSYSEENVDQDSSKSPSMSIGLFVISLLVTLHHPTQRALARSYLPLKYSKSANEGSVYQVSSKLD